MTDNLTLKAAYNVVEKVLPLCWQPVDTVAKNGDYILARQHDRIPTVVFWTDDGCGGGFWTSSSCDCMDDWEPDEWIPLPKDCR
jgi:hypothetical protein